MRKWHRCFQPICVDVVSSETETSPPQETVRTGLLVWSLPTTSWSVLLSLVQFQSQILHRATWLLCRHTLWWHVKGKEMKSSEFSRNSRSRKQDSFYQCYSSDSPLPSLLSCELPSVSPAENNRSSHLLQRLWSSSAFTSGHELHLRSGRERDECSVTVTSQ